MSKRLLAKTAAVVACLAIAPPLCAEPSVRAVAHGTAHDGLFAIAAQGGAGLAVGDAGVILQSRDRGAWNAVSPPITTLGLLGAALQGGHALAVGQMGVVLKRDEAGGAWQEVSSGVKERLFAVAMNARGQAVAVGGFGTVIASPDFGATWRAIAPDWDKYAKDGQQPHIYDVAIDASGVVTLAGEFGLILRSTDEKSWQTLHSGDASIFAMRLLGDGTGFAVGQTGLVLRTKNGGTSWQTMNAGTTAILLGVGATQDGHVIATAMHDLVASDDDGATWRHIGGAPFASSWYEGVADAGPGGPWLVAGHSGQLLEIGK